jgi:hypothetical protein
MAKHTTAKKLLVLGMALSTSVVLSAQSKTGSRSTPVHHHREARHTAGTIASGGESKRLDASIARLETQTTKAAASSQRRTPAARATAPSRATGVTDRRGNPPINFAYKGKSTGTHSNGGSRSAGKHASVRMK